MLVKGSINGMLARTFARIDKLAWDLQTRTVELRVTSFRKQDITLISRYGIEDIGAPAGVLAAALKRGIANCDLRLPEETPVTIHLKLGSRQPNEWINQMAV